MDVAYRKSSSSTVDQSNTTKEEEVLRREQQSFVTIVHIQLEELSADVCGELSMIGLMGELV